MNLYKWQNQALRKWEDNQYHGIIDVVTGVGKTVFALACAQHLQNKGLPLRIRIVVPKISLLRQWQKEIINFFPHYRFETDAIGMIGNGRNDSYDHIFSLYVINSARYVLSKHIRNDFQDGYYTLLICDECHHYASECNSLIFRFLNDKSYDRDHYYSLGLSATPYCEHFEDVLKPNLGDVIFTYNLKNARKDKRISDFVFFNIGIDLSGKEARQYGTLSEEIALTYRKMLHDHPEFKDLSENELFSACNKHLKDEPDSLPALFILLIRKRRDLIANTDSRFECLKDILDKINENRIIIFSERIDQCDRIYELLKNSYKIRVSHYHSQMDEQSRKQNLEFFRIKETDVLVTCKALDEGLNVPDASTAIVFSSSAMSRQRIQRLGRILRKDVSKDISSLYYLFLRNTVEDSLYLNTDEIISFDYHYSGKTFYSEIYAKAAMEIYRKYQSDSSAEKLKELKFIIEEGILRSDCILKESIYRNRIENAQSNHDRNYWIIMKMISQKIIM